MKMKLSIVLVGLTCMSSLHTFTTLNYNDMFPPFSTKYSFDLMNDEDKEILKDKDIKGIYERVQFSSTFIGQKATRARDLNKVSVVAGDVHGRLGMIPLLYGDLPSGYTRPAILQALIDTPVALTGLTGATLDNDSFSDPNQNFGFFSLPVKYRKVAGRFKASVRIIDDVVITVQAGIADMKQTLTLYTDKTFSANYQDVFHGNILANAANFEEDKSSVEVNLMDIRTQLFTQMDVNGEDWSDTGAEDVSVSLAWRHNIRINKDEDPEDWARFVFTPHFLLAATFGAGKASDPDVLLSLPFGNNKHHAMHFASGFNVDFYESVELSFEAGGTHFFDRTYETRVPTSEFQSVLFPYKATVKVEPGKTWHVSIGMNAHHFIDKLSMYALYSYIQHLTDTITIPTPPAPVNTFIPRKLQDQSAAKVQNARIGFNYDLSPNMTFGFLWQAPIAQRASYKATTIALSAIFTF